MSLKSILVIAVTAAGYWGLGRLSTFFAIPPGFASPVWPAAGFAFLMVLNFGPRCVLGITVASFLLNLGISQSSLFEFSMAWLPAMGIAVGATLQALVAYCLVQRFTCYPDLLQRANDSIWLGVFGGPLACVVSASIGVISLVLGGVLAWEVALVNWFHWWVGDSIGVLCFAPLIVAHSQVKYWTVYTRVSTFFAVYLLGVVMAISLFAMARDSQEDKVAQLFVERAEGIHAGMAKHLDNIRYASQSLAALFGTINNLSLKEFELYTDAVYTFEPSVQAYSWVPIVSAAERRKYEMRMTKQTGKPFYFKQRDAQGKLVRATERARYFPVYYIAPIEGNRDAHGFDLGLEQRRRQALDRAATLQKSTITEPIHLVQSHGTEVAILMITPVIDQSKVVGFVSSVYPASRLLNAALNRILGSEIAIEMMDVTLPKDAKFLFKNGLQGEGNVYKRNIAFGERIWQLRLQPTEKFVRDHQSLEVWVVLIAGFLIVAIFGLFMLLVMSRSVVVENEVASKTRALNVALQSAEKASQVKSAFLASMSHELRTPLNSIIGFSVRLQKRYKDNGDERLLDALSVIQKNGAHLLGLINDILDLSKVEAGKMQVRKAPVEIEPLIDEITQSLSTMLEAKGLQLVVKNIPIKTLKVDRKRFAQILINLLSNAIKFTSEGSVTLKFLKESRRDTPGFAVQVIDTGPGINKENMGKLFRKYEQLGDTFQAGEMGTGLGLALTQELVHAHGGELGVESRPGEGATFTVWLPLE